MSAKQIKLQTSYGYTHTVPDNEIFAENEGTLIKGVERGMKLYIEKYGDKLKISTEIKYLFRNAHKLGLHLHLPEISVLEDVPDVLLVCDGWNKHVCKTKIRQQKMINKAMLPFFSD